MRLGESVAGMTPGTRDAIHLPVVVTKALGHVKPGDRVVFTNKDMSAAGAPSHYDPDPALQLPDELWHGIMDPVATEEVEKGDLFLVVLNPALMAGRPLWHEFEFEFEPVKESQIYAWNCSGC